MLAEVAPGETAIAALLSALALVLVAVIPTVVAVMQGRKTRTQNTAEHQLNGQHLRATAEHLVELHERVTHVGEDASAARTAAEHAAVEAHSAAEAATDACARIDSHLEWHRGES